MTIEYDRTLVWIVEFLGSHFVAPNKSISHGASTEQLLTVYQTRVHSTLEFAEPAFHSSLIKEQGRKIEMVQKKPWLSS